MRTTFYMLLLSLFMTHFLFGQKDTTKIMSTKAINEFYILEETWVPLKRHFKMDDTPNFLQLEGGKILMSGRVRQYGFFVFGEMDGFKNSSSVDETIYEFYVRGREFSAGMIASFEITERSEDDVLIHFYQKLGRMDRYFKAHVASEEEIKAIKAYWEGTR